MNVNALDQESTLSKEDLLNAFKLMTTAKEMAVLY
jgi:hypothetical protein